jgi:hypothetical protein
MVGFPHGTALGLAHSQQRMTKQPTKQHKQKPLHCLPPTLNDSNVKETLPLGLNFPLLSLPLPCNRSLAGAVKPLTPIAGLLQINKHSTGG